MTETDFVPEAERKELWFDALAKFIVEGNKNTWAVDKGEVPPDKIERKGFREHEYTRGYWRMRDSYKGYFRAPGATTLYYKGVPVWMIQYGGKGQSEAYLSKAKETFKFLGRALEQVAEDMPIRGPEKYTEGNMVYTFRIKNKSFAVKPIEDSEWEEEITEGDFLVFKQSGTAGIIIDKDENRKPIYPWNL